MKDEVYREREKKKEKKKRSKTLLYKSRNHRWKMMKKIIVKYIHTYLHKYISAGICRKGKMLS